MPNYLFNFISFFTIAFISINMSTAHAETRFRLMYGSKPFVSEAHPDFSCLNDSTKQWFNCELLPTSVPGEFVRGDLAAGSYVIRLDVDANRNNPKNYPGDFHADHRFQIPIGSANPVIEVTVARFLHLLEPQSNDGTVDGALGDDCTKKPRFISHHLPWSRDVSAKFRWETLTPETIYKVSIVKRKCDQYADLGIVKKWESLTASEIVAELPENEPGEYYAFYLNGFKDQKLMGEFFTYSEGMQSWSYGFRVERKLPKTLLLAIALTLMIVLVLWFGSGLSTKKTILRKLLAVFTIFGIPAGIFIQQQQARVEFQTSNRAPKAVTTQVKVPPSYQWKDLVPKPADWDATTVSFEIHNYSELMQRWQSQRQDEASQRELFRAIYSAIDKFPEDEHLAVTGMNFLGYLTNESSIKIAIGKVAMSYHFNYKQQTNNCANCAVGDTTADLAMQYATILFTSQKKLEANAVLDEILIKRETEISPWKAVEVRMQRIRQYQSLGNTDKAVSELNDTLRKYPNTERSSQLKLLQQELVANKSSQPKL